MLSNIDPDHVDDARRLLTLLCFARRPMTVPELIDAVAVDLNEPTGLNKNRRMQDADDLCALCPGILEVFWPKIREPVLRIAHFSVQEYLESERMKHQKASIFGITSHKAHAEIARICVIYLLTPNLSPSGAEGRKDLRQDLPLAEYAVDHWHRHYKHAGNLLSNLNNLILALFQHPHFRAWTGLEDERTPLLIFDGIDGFDWDFSERVLHTSWENPIFQASRLGLDQLLEVLLSDRISGGTWDSDLSFVDSALYAAVYHSHEKAVERLLHHGANANIYYRGVGNVLCIASYNGHEKITQLLLHHGATVHATEGFDGNAITRAAWTGEKSIVQLLLDHGADKNASDPLMGNALDIASSRGHEELVHYLLAKGAHVHGDHGMSSTALRLASRDGHRRIVQVLLAHEADPNFIPGGSVITVFRGTALQQASRHGYEDIVRLLLDHGADANVSSHDWGSSLQEASCGGFYQIVQLLLNHGADVNAQHGGYPSALREASDAGHHDVVQLFLDNGATWQVDKERIDDAGIYLRQSDRNYKSLSNAVKAAEIIRIMNERRKEKKEKKVLESSVPAQ